MFESFQLNLKIDILPSLKSITGMLCALFILSACGASDPVASNNTRSDSFTKIDEPAPANLESFQTAEYKRKDADGNVIEVKDFKESVKAAYAYGNIETMIADDSSSTIRQGGKGGVVSVIIQSEFTAPEDNLFATIHPEFNVESEDRERIIGVAFDSIYNAYNDTFYANYTSDPDDGGTNCVGANCVGTQYAALIAGRKDNNAQEMHGIAYNAKIKGIITDATNETQLEEAIKQGVGSNIIAMDYNLPTETINICYDGEATYPQYYTRHVGSYQGLSSSASANGCSTIPTEGKRLSDKELGTWRDAVTDSDPDDADIGNNTIMVFSTGNAGFNSETGIISIEPTDPTIALAEGYQPDNLAALSVIGGDNPMAANIPNLRAAYPVLYDEDDPSTTENEDFTSGRWLAVAAVDEKNVIRPIANGCGVAMRFCLVAPGKNIYTTGASNSGYAEVEGVDYASSTVAGALAVLEGAFPNATPEQLTKLVLDTATYIPLDGRDSSDGTSVRLRGRFRLFTEELLYRQKVKTADGRARYINPVYGYGLLNLAAATSPSVTSYVTASNNESIGVLWTDTTLTLSSHFGDNFESVKFGIGDVYGRHFTTTAPQVNHTPVAIGLDDYMSNLLGDNVQSETLGTQARANYSNSAQSWMDLQYTSGKATTKIAFQESYKINPLVDMGASSILRANNIRPASKNIGMMDVDYQLGRNLKLSSYAARGEYDTGYKFDELGTDIDLRHKKSTINIGIGNVREHDQFLGTNTTGAYALREPSISRFTDVTYGHDVGKKFNVYANYINYKTEVDMGYSHFATIDNLQADQYQVGFKGKNLISDDDGLNVALITKLGVTDGALTQNTVLGYTADGGFNNVSQSYDLSVQERHQQFEITYQGRLYQHTQNKVSALKNNRFFTTLRVDQNLNHVQDASQTEIVSGINARF